MKNSIINIKINVAYDDIKNSNLSEYEIHPEWLTNVKVYPKKYLKWVHIDNVLGNEFLTFNKNTTEYFSNSNESFIYPIVLYSNQIFETYTTIDLNDTLLQCIKNKKAKIIFFYITEGQFGESILHYNWLDNLVLKYNLELDDLTVITSNLLSEEYYTENKFKIISYNYFNDELFFARINKKDELNIKLFKNRYLNFIDNFNIEKHFLCFNNLSKLHRLWMFYELMNNPKLKNKSILSLNKNTSYKSFSDIISSTTNVEMIEYYKTYDSTIGYTYDTTNWEMDVERGDTINIDAHLKTFVNVITETLITENVVFITEKTYKSIYTCQPFIIVGNAYSLKKMKEFGFTTFDKWWDESYDTELNFEKRMYKITKVLEEIASWDFEKCMKVRSEMKEILINNFKQMLNNSELHKIYKFLQTDVREVKPKFL